MKVGDKVVSKEFPGLGVMTVRYVDPVTVPHRIVTLAIPEDAKDEEGNPSWNAGGLDDGDYEDLKVTEPCSTCAGRDAETHIRADHDEDYLINIMNADEE